MIYFITVDPANGRVLGHCGTPDATSARMYQEASPDAIRTDREPPSDWHRKRFVDGAFLDLTEPVIPDEFAVRGAILRELSMTDYTQLPDYPLAPDQRAAWSAYRQALRAINNGPITSATLASFPSDPKGRNLAQASGWI